MILKYIKIAWVLINLRLFLDPWGQNSIRFMFTGKSIVMNMHKRVMFFLFFFHSKWREAKNEDERD